MNIQRPYDYIFAGSGLAALTLCTEMLARPAFRDKKMLLIDRDDKTANDRTWCFWADPEEPLPPVVYKTWGNCLFQSEWVDKQMDIKPLRYNMVRGKDFYAWALAQIAKHPNVERVQATIGSVDAEKGLVRTDCGDFEAELIFNSAFTKTALLPPPEPGYAHPPLSAQAGVQEAGYTYLLQHFKGWLIETPADAPVFDPETMTFMDFRVPQQDQTRFVYVLPLNPHKALVEFTVFSPALLPQERYDAELRRYLQDYLSVTRFDILESEFGVIPMTDNPMQNRQQGHVIHIGTAGGFVKASSGYAFKRTGRKVRQFVDAWEQSGRPDPEIFRSAWRFRAFDSIFLKVLANQNGLGARIFSNLFQKLPAAFVLRFLDEDVTFAGQLRLASAAPWWPFIVAAFRQMFRLNKV